MKVYDCFSFFNELDLLEIRLHELDAVVDFFVLVEATKTHQKKPKPLYYNENKNRFEKFHHKIRHVIVENYPTFFYRFKAPKAIDYDLHQKDQIKRALTDCAPDDVIVYSDVDEIPNPKSLLANKQQTGIVVFQQRIYHYFLNCIEVDRTDAEQPAWWYGSVMTQYKNFKSAKKLRVFREIQKYKGSKVVEDGGWHFTSLGGVEKIIHKIESFMHDEFNKEHLKNPSRIKELIENGKSVFDQDIKCHFIEIDETFPEYIRQNKEKLEQYIHTIN